MRLLLRIAIRAAALIGLLLAVHFVGEEVMTTARERLQPLIAAHGYHAIAIAVLAYIVLMSTPFVPGMELSLMLMVLLGVEGIVIVYLATVVALSISYWVGVAVPARSVTGVLGWMHLHRARDFAAHIYPMSADEKLSLLIEAAPKRIVPFLIRHRYLLLAVVFNVPGNSLIGGGGGIGFVAGLSRLFDYPKYLLTVCLAISPIPLIFLTRALLALPD